MPSNKQSLKEVLKQLSSKEKREAIKWIDSLSKKQLEELEELNRIHISDLLIEKYLKCKGIESHSSPKK